MKTIKITVEIDGEYKAIIHQEIENETFQKIKEICNEYKTNIGSLIINDITEMTPDRAEEIISSWNL